MSDQASTIQVNTIEPQSGTTLTVGKSGQNLVVNADSLKANVAKDAGGNALFTSDGSGTISGLNSGFGSAQTLISTTTVSSAVASIAFTSGLDSTYKEYVFEFININPVTNNAFFQFQMGSSYNTTVTSSIYIAYHNEADNDAVLQYVHDAGSDYDQAQGTSFQQLCTVGNGADNCASGELHLYNPASTTYVKNFYSTAQVLNNTSYSRNMRVAGYFNTTSALTQAQFKFSSGNINAGTIKMYGIK